MFAMASDLQVLHIHNVILSYFLTMKFIGSGLCYLIVTCY